MDATGLGSFVSLHRVLEPLPHLPSELIIVRLRSAPTRAGPRNHKLAYHINVARRTQRRQHTHLAVVVECLGHRTRIQLREGAVLHGPQEQYLLYHIVSPRQLVRQIKDESEEDAGGQGR